MGGLASELLIVQMVIVCFVISLFILVSINFKYNGDSCS